MKGIKLIVTAGLLSLFSAFSAFADYNPHEPEFVISVNDLPPEDEYKLCFSGHNVNVTFNDGIKISKDSEFEVLAENEDADASLLSAEIALIYENNKHDGNQKEVLKIIDNVNLRHPYKFFSDIQKTTLKSRGRLYSDNLSSIVVSLKDGIKNTSHDYYFFVED